MQGRRGPDNLIDVTLPLTGSLPVYPGNPPFALLPIKRLARGDSSNVSGLSLGCHSGTHVDAPRHFFDDGPDAAQLALDRLVGPARVLEIRAARAIEPRHLAEVDLGDELRLLFKTSNSGLWGRTAFTTEYVFLIEAGARYLVDRGVQVVGIDYLSIEELKRPGAPAHRALLGSGAIVIEGLNLLDVQPGAYEMICLPLRIPEADGAPARVLLRGPRA